MSIWSNGSLPKIGIRPIIDGRRRGVRESLEDQTMGMARAVARLIHGTLKYPNGRAVECIIADDTIGGVAEAARCAEKFARAGVGVCISVTPCWCYGTETIQMDPTIPTAIWGFNGTERPGAVYLAAALAGHSQKGVPAFGIYGHDVQDADDSAIPEDVRQKLLQFARAGVAAALMRGRSYLSIGSVAMGIAGSTVDPEFFQKYLGMRNEYVDMSEITRRIDEGIYDREEFDRALAWAKANCREGKDYNPPENRRTIAQKESDWETCVKMTLIARDLLEGNPLLDGMGYGEEAEGHNAIAGGFQGQRQWTDHFPNGDFMETILNTSFDWNGTREPIPFATENDSLNGVTMLLSHLLTGRAQIFSDVRSYWSPAAVKRVTGWQPLGRAEDGFIHLINSGATTLDATGKMRGAEGPVMKPFWEIEPADAQKCLDATSWCPASTGYFRGGGFSAHFLTEGGMPVTMARINLVDGLGPFLQIAEGYTVDLPEKVFDIINRRTDPGWPSTFFAPNLTGRGAFTDVYSVMNAWGANHGAISCGHIGGDLITLASILRIPVAMHNVPAARLFRPSAWNGFGTEDRESADYRACRSFGPLYGKV